ncbi:MAG: hypothetical protein H7145_24420 [Akkermansiaceae bacterium]|nr:hypothetical protein [Armatimonadota bacterium]
MKLEQTVDIGTDVAAFFVFHPGDLQHRSDDPLDWYDYDFACRKEFESGNLVAFRTGGDGGYQLRITSGDLTSAEREHETGSWAFGYTVRHGRVLLDNGDFLPSGEARPIGKASKDQWVDVANGDYRVTVHPIARNDNSLPDYVVRFEPVDNPLRIAASPTPPDLIGLVGETPRAAHGMSADSIHGSRAEDKPLDRAYPLLVAPGQYVLPGGNVSVPVSDAIFEAVSGDDRSLLNVNEGGDIYLVLAPTGEIPGLATLVWQHGSSQLAGEPGRISLRGERLVRVKGQRAGGVLPEAEVEPVTRKTSVLEKSEIAALQEAFAAYVDSHPKGRSAVRASLFEREWVAAMTSGDALTTRLIALVPMPVETRFRLYEASDAERARELISLLKPG